MQNSECDKFMYSEVSDFSAWKVRSKDSNLFYERETTMLSGDTWVLCTDIQMNLLDVISRGTKTLVDIVGKKTYSMESKLVLIMFISLSLQMKIAIPIHF